MVLPEAVPIFQDPPVYNFCNRTTPGPMSGQAAARFYDERRGNDAGQDVTEACLAVSVRVSSTAVPFLPKSDAIDKSG